MYNPNPNVFSDPDIRTTGAEVLTNTKDVVLTCTVSDIDKEPSLTWFYKDTELTTDANYNVGNLTFKDKIASSELTILKSVSEEENYTCSVDVSSSTYSKTASLLLYGM